MSEGREIEFLGDVQRLQLAPGDILVLKTLVSMNHEMAKRLRDAICETLGDPDRKVLVLSDGLEIGVLAPASES